MRYESYTQDTLETALALAYDHGLHDHQLGAAKGGLLHIYEGILHEGFEASDLLTRVVLAFDEQEPIGIALVTHPNPFLMVYVQPEHRRHGVGNTLLTHLSPPPQCGAYFNTLSWGLFKKHRLIDLVRQP